LVFEGTWEIRYAVGNIAEHHPSLAEHLNIAINTGTFCSCAPQCTAVRDLGG
jgi:hypothetical protein